MTTIYARAGKIVELGAETIAALKCRYPTKDVERELAKMHLWTLSRKSDARRPKDVWAFVRNWLLRADSVVRPEPPRVAAWWATPERTVNQGEAMGIRARPGESLEQLRDRISAAMGRTN